MTCLTWVGGARGDTSGTTVNVTDPDLCAEEEWWLIRLFAYKWVVGQVALNSKNPEPCSKLYKEWEGEGPGGG